MNKNGALVILNDLKKQRDDVEKKYNIQKNKKLNDNQALLYCLGFASVFIGTCVICPANFMACSSILVAYGMGVPCTYAYCLFSKEEKLRKELEKLNKNIHKLEFEVVGINVNHHYIDEKRGFVFKEEKVKERIPYIPREPFVEEYVQEEKGPSLILKK